MTGWTDAGNFAIQQQLKADINELQSRLNKSRQETNDWYAYAQKLEEGIMDLASKLDAAYELTERLIDGDPELSKPESGELRRKLLVESAARSRKSMDQAHAVRAKGGANTKRHTIENVCLPIGRDIGRKLSIIKARKGEPSQSIGQMQQILLDLGPELAAANNLVLRLLAEANGQQVEEKLLPAGNHDARRAFLESRAKTSRDGMIGKGVQELQETIETTLGNQQIKISKQITAPIQRPERLNMI